MFVKICGITRRDDALHAARHGADALGFVFWPGSPRRIDASSAAGIIAELPAGVTSVGVFVNESVDGIRRVIEQTGISAVQLHGDEPADYATSLGWPVLRAVRVDEADAICPAWPPHTTFLLDAADSVRRGGTGTVVDWDRAAAIARTRRIVLAGGLTERNVWDAIVRVGPYGVDVSSGVEDAPGVKNLDKVARFLERARSAFEQGDIGHD
ncbi:MAG: phosphoribosylanthranilate isomerase [Acidobacteria bacterium]|nr:phosphoribosylanthranilate isomerase [Acidobacteriota bacterium]